MATNDAELVFIHSAPGPATNTVRSAIYTHVAKRAHAQRRHRAVEVQQTLVQNTVDSILSPPSPNNLPQFPQSERSAYREAYHHSNINKEKALQLYDEQKQEQRDAHYWSRDSLTNDMKINNGFQSSCFSIPPKPYFHTVYQHWRENVRQTLAPNTYSLEWAAQYEITAHAGFSTCLAVYPSIEAKFRAALLHHRGETIRLLAGRISSNSTEIAFSDDTIFVIACLILTDTNLKWRKEAVSHLNGLRKIVALRGGVDRIGVDTRLKAIVLACEWMVKQLVEEELMKTPEDHQLGQTGAQADALLPAYSMGEVQVSTLATEVDGDI